NAISFLFGGIVLLIFNIVVGKPAIFTFTPLNLLFMAYLGLIITGLSYLLYFEGMKKITASKASVYFFLKPALASFLAYTILKETLSTGQVIGIILVVFSLGRSLFGLSFPKKALAK
ncbi:MAG: DMT family transporter, partial [Candidatus Cloacimonetes bacterium]|nr:DMT family transporter [Candidatus Cloacimonadota bacterium]